MRRHANSLVLTALSALLLLTPAPAAKAEADAPPAEINVFEAPLMAEMLDHVFRVLKAGRFVEAEEAMRAFTARFPDQAQGEYLLATILAVRGKKADALAMLSAAVTHGFRDAALLQRDANLDPIRDEPEFTDIAERILNSPPPEWRTMTHSVPGVIHDGIAPVESENTSALRRFHTLFTEFEPPRETGARVVQTTGDAVANQLNLWYKEGRAAGNVGDLYDNRDHQHSLLPRDAYPQLSLTRYGEDARDAGVDYGLNNKILFNRVTFGNSSTAVTGGAFWRSQARLALTDPAGVGHLFLQYIRNHLYVYPAVSDYDPAAGDVLTANSPYMIISNGRSGSDQPFLHAIASILAAFRPEVKAHLAAHNLIAPTVQMLLRQGQATVKTSADYLTYKAHPPVFDAANIDLLRMIEAAQALTIDEVPPMVMLEVLKEDGPRPGIDDFSRFRSETLHTTPGLITRAVRSAAYRKTMTVSAEKTEIPPGQTLSYHWTVLRGDPAEIRITPKNSNGSIVEISVPWHALFAAPERRDLTTARVEIGVFVHNGRNYSAPAFINFLYPANQYRRYDDEGRLLSIAHDGEETAGNYIDPQVFARRHWRDDYSYDAAGALIGWQRSGHGQEESFTRDGALIVARDTLGRAVRAERVTYPLAKDAEGLPVIRMERTGQFLIYEYAGDGDRIGRPRPQ